ELGITAALGAMLAFLPVAGRAIADSALARSTTPIVETLRLRLHGSDLLAHEGAIEQSASVALALDRSITIVNRRVSTLAFGATLEVARQLGLQVFVHNRNYGYGANQKTCYTEALRAGADIVVMVHPDYQYDPRLVPQIIEPIVEGQADVVLGSRLKSGSPIAQGMPWWKYVANRVLTRLEHWAFGLGRSEYHTGH